MALEESTARHKAHSMDWLRDREALKAQLLGLMKALEENRQVAQQLSFNVGPQPIETRQDRRGTEPPRRAAQLRRRVPELERRDRIRPFQEREEREHLIRKRNWLEVEKRRLDADCMELQFLERERQRTLERYGMSGTGSSGSGTSCAGSRSSYASGRTTAPARGPTGSRGDTGRGGPTPTPYPATTRVAGQSEVPRAFIKGWRSVATRLWHSAPGGQGGRLWRRCTTDSPQMAPVRTLVPIIEMRST